MSKVLRCRDAGTDCDFEARSDDEERLLEIAKKHAREAHGIPFIPKPYLDKIRALIREE